MSINARTPVHQCFYLGEEDIDPVLLFTRYLVRNPQYARQRHADCEVNIYVVDRPQADRLACPASYLRKVTTTMGAIRAAAMAITGEDFSRPPPTAAQTAARKAKKQAKKAKKAALQTPLIAMIIAGGSGTRLGGCCKAMLTLADGRTILSHLRACCRLAGVGRVVINANDPAAFAGCGLEVVADLRAGLGPVGGIETAVRCAAGHAAEAVLLLASDLPAMTPAVLNALIGGWQRSHRPQVAWSRLPEPRMHPLCAIVGIDAGAEVASAIDAGELAVHRLWTSLGAEAVWFEDASAFANLNTPEDLARWTVRSAPA